MLQSSYWAFIPNGRLSMGLVLQSSTENSWACWPCDSHCLHKYMYVHLLLICVFRIWYCSVMLVIKGSIWPVIHLLWQTNQKVNTYFLFVNQSAFSITRAVHLYVFLNFSGSWVCAPCKRRLSKDGSEKTKQDTDKDEADKTGSKPQQKAGMVTALWCLLTTGFSEKFSVIEFSERAVGCVARL